ncbi:MAG TPA: SUMF1/EgtB/PvdO family nonheme iron enzyme [Verrucomicrobiales bacterium]|nr:SUMF1/EgtB/PvdO family nonheme iron enzyme [Verrucomicrobiales bacterium]
MKPAFFFLISLPLSLQAAPPNISNVTAGQRAGTKLVDIHYNVSDLDSNSLTVQIELSANGGRTYDLPAKSLTGAVGAGVPPGTGKLITWDAGKDWNGNWSPNCKARLWAHDGSTPVPPLGMVYIPAGTFDMGSSPDVIGKPVTLTHSFFMDRTEVTAELWNEVRDWSITHGYIQDGLPRIGDGVYLAPGHPIHSVNFNSCVIWCNARSEKEGLTPCYYDDEAQSTVMRSFKPTLTKSKVKWTANGYRLPTEAEWERASRGGMYRKNYFSGDTLNTNQANGVASGDPFEVNPALDGPAGTTPCNYYNGTQVPAGPDCANGYGLYDTAGNVMEWCWPSDPGAAPTDPINDVWYTSIFDVGRGAFYTANSRGGGWKWGVEGLKNTAAQQRYAIFYAVGQFSTFSEDSRDQGVRTIRGL